MDGANWNPMVFTGAGYFLGNSCHPETNGDEEFFFASCFIMRVLAQAVSGGKYY